MKIKRFKAENFRNISSCDIEFCDGVNLLYGKNAQGKTNAIEGIYMFSRGKSFRANDDKELIGFDKQGFRIILEYESLNGEETLEYACFGRERQRKKNGYKITRLTEMISSFKSVLFYPDNLDLVKDGPEERRAFLNVAVAQCYPKYLNDYTMYRGALENRNKLLKMASKGYFVDERELYAWSESMADYASYIYCERIKYLKKLEVYLERIGFELSCGREKITLEYKSSIDYTALNIDESALFDMSGYERVRVMVKDEYLRLLTNLENERLAGTSLYGPHRDDVVIYINGKNARSYASQGQQRSIVLAMKLAEGEVIKEIYGEYPVFLFDDVLSELDEERRKYVVGGMGKRQVIVTSCEAEMLMKNADRVIEVKEGEYVSSRG